jgi:hypothetical protein
MANCSSLTAGYTTGCKDGISGVYRVYMNNFSGDTSYTYDSNGTVTGMTSGNTSFYKFEQRNETASFKQDGTHNNEIGNNFWTQELTLQFLKYQASQRNLIYSLAVSQLLIIVETNDGRRFLMGEEFGADLSASASNVGKTLADPNTSDLTFMAKSTTPVREISSTLFNTFTLV